MDRDVRRSVFVLCRRRTIPAASKVGARQEEGVCIAVRVAHWWWRLAGQDAFEFAVRVLDDQFYKNQHVIRFHLEP